MNLNERQEREKEYYDQYAKQYDLNQEINFSPIDGPLNNKESRPWNSYWKIYQLAIEYFQDNSNKNDLTILDFGCGPGENAVRFERIGYKVKGFDISPENVSIAQKIFQHKEISENGDFTVSGAETLPYDDNSFDIIIGIDILHHVDIKLSLNECRRVLKSGGVAYFREPLEVPAFDKIRNLSLVRKFFPNDMSLERHTTEDERKLNQNDLNMIESIFPSMEIEKFLMLSRFDTLLRKHEDPSSSFLEKLDYTISKKLSWFNDFGGAMIIKVNKN